MSILRHARLLQNGKGMSKAAALVISSLVIAVSTPAILWTNSECRIREFEKKSALVVGLLNKWEKKFIEKENAVKKSGGWSLWSGGASQGGKEVKGVIAEDENKFDEKEVDTKKDDKKKGDEKKDDESGGKKE